MYVLNSFYGLEKVLGKITTNLNSHAGLQIHSGRYMVNYFMSFVFKLVSVSQRPIGLVMVTFWISSILLWYYRKANSYSFTICLCHCTNQLLPRKRNPGTYQKILFEKAE